MSMHRKNLEFAVCIDCGAFTRMQPKSGGYFCRFCPKCAYSRHNNWRANNRDKSNAYQADYSRRAYKKNPRHFVARIVKCNYGITIEELDAMILERQGRCDVCNKAADLNIDHDHATGKVRGLLCRDCNAMLGFAKDNCDTLLKGIEYLRGTK